MHVRVQGGTGAGRKPPLRDKPKEWVCLCPADPELDMEQAGAESFCIVFTRRPGYLVRCPDCGAQRP